MAFPVPRAVRWIGVAEAEGSSGINRSMLSHRYVFSRFSGDSRTRRTSPGAGLRDQTRPIVYAVRHETDCPHVAAQLVHFSIHTEGLHLAAVHAKVHVADTTDLAVVSGVGVYHLDEVGVTGVQTIHQTRPEKRTRRIQADYPVKSIVSRF